MSAPELSRRKFSMLDSVAKCLELSRFASGLTAFRQNQQIMRCSSPGARNCGSGRRFSAQVICRRIAKKNCRSGRMNQRSGLSTSRSHRSTATGSIGIELSIATACK